MTNREIIVFSTPACPWCVQLKNYLREKEIDYTERDVSKDEKAADEMFHKSHHLGVPQMWVGEETIVGFDIKRINHLLKIK